MDNSKFELLFWKVFHNKYLLNYVINKIHTTEWIKYENPNEIREDNRCKFKDTHKLDIMLSNKLYSLIKLKIQHNEFIKISVHSIRVLFDQIKKCQENSSINQQVPYEILLLLLSNRRLDFEICDLTELAVIHGNLKILKLLINEPYSMVVYPLTLELAIQASSVDMVKELIILQLKNPTKTILTNDIKKHSLKSSSRNQLYASEMIEYILNNPAIFKIEDEDNKEEKEVKQPIKKFKSSYQLQPINYYDTTTTTIGIDSDIDLDSYTDSDSDSEFDKPIDETTIDYYYFKSLKNIELMNRLMELDLVSYENPTNLEDRYNLDLSFNQLLILIKAHFKYYKITINSEINDMEKGLNEITITQNLKQLQQFLISNILETAPKVIKTKLEFHLKYGIDQNEEAKDLFENEILFNNAILNCDIEKLKELDESMENPLLRMNECIEFEFTNPINSSEMLKLIEYLGDSGYKSFTSDLFKSFYIRIFESSKIPVSSIKFNIENILFSQDFNVILLESIVELNLQMVELLINNLPIIELNNEEYMEFQNFLEEHVKIIKFESQISSKIYQTKINIQYLISIIKLIVNKYCNNVSGETPSRTYQILLNYLFGILISSKGIKSEEIKQIYQLLNSHLIQINHTMFNSIYYLHSLDIKFTKFIISIPIFVYSYLNKVYFFNTSDGDIGSGSEDEDANGNKIDGIYYLNNYLKSSVFTYDYIFGGSNNNDILDLLIKYSNEIISKLVLSETSFKRMVNSRLHHFLDIKRVDLFFKQLEFIQQLQQKPEIQEQRQFKQRLQISLFYKSHDLFYKSPINSIKDTSIYYTQLKKLKEKDIERGLEEGEKEGGNQVIPLSIVIYKPANKILVSACKVMDLEQIQKLIEFYYNKSFFQNRIFSSSIQCNRFEVSRFIMDNYEKNICIFPRYSRDRDYCSILEFQFIVSNYFEYVKFPNLLKPKLQTFKDYKFIDDLPKLLLIFISSSPIHINPNQEQKLIDNQLKLKQQFIDVLNDSGSGGRHKEEEFLSKFEIILSDVINSLGESYGLHSKFDEIELTNFDETKNNLLNQVFKNENIQKILKKLTDNYLSTHLLKKYIDEENDNTVIINNTYFEENDNMFIKAFIEGEIRLCNLILHYYPNKFKITIYGITQAISKNNIHIIKYYFNDNIKIDQELLQHLKIQLLGHADYKFDLDWVN